jgi:hypothetical protein
MKAINRRFGGALAAVFLSLSAGGSLAGGIEGRIVGLDGRPLDKVGVCLAEPGQPDECASIRKTNKQGRYSFTGLKDAGTYTVSVYTDTSVSNRKFEQYPAYVWTPARQSVELAQAKDNTEAQPIVGEFSYSNFQRRLVLVEGDFPELAQFDFLSEYVALKVSVPSDQPDTAPDTIYLAQVRDPSTLKIEASLPLAVTSILYEIFSSSLAVQSSIVVREAQ